MQCKMNQKFWSAVEGKTKYNYYRVGKYQVRTNANLPVRDSASYRAHIIADFEHINSRYDILELRAWAQDDQ